MESLLAEIEYHASQIPDSGMFALWRAVFSLVHEDGELAEAERNLVAQVMDVFRFSLEQRAIVERDMEAAGDARRLFQEIELSEYRSQFFRLARIVIWCDGVLHDDELAVIHDIQDDLGDEAAVYEADLRWMNRKPDLPLGEQAGSPEEEMIKHMIYQMIAFYKQMER
ncbi:MAG: TerB family tellurite resistance protein [Rhodospirillales bacterium]|nr:TerB family tellurite resistance protein [Alphaproteobacteria bacterium]MCB9981317.1 TerB family tellurite resistance protein [Rhodospirillales bacterium]